MMYYVTKFTEILKTGVRLECGGSGDWKETTTPSSQWIMLPWWNICGRLALLAPWTFLPQTSLSSKLSTPYAPMSVPLIQLCSCGVCASLLVSSCGPRGAKGQSALTVIVPSDTRVKMVEHRVTDELEDTGTFYSALWPI